MGIFVNTSGKIIDPGDPYTVKNSIPDAFRALQYNLLFSTEVGYSIDEHWRITMRPQLKLNLNSIYNKDQGYQLRYLFSGVNIVAAYRF